MSLGSSGIALAIAATALTAARRSSATARVGIAAGAVAAAFTPWGGMSLAGYLRGVAGELSITTSFLLAVIVIALAGGPGLRSRRELDALGAFVLLGASFLYPMALGLTRFDPYALGYSGGSIGLLAALALTTLVAWLARRLLLLMAIVLALAGHQLLLLESQNLWDYLLDPWLVLSMALWLGARFTIFGRISPILGKREPLSKPSVVR